MKKHLEDEISDKTKSSCVTSKWLLTRLASKKRQSKRSEHKREPWLVHSGRQTATHIKMVMAQFSSRVKENLNEYKSNKKKEPSFTVLPNHNPFSLSILGLINLESDEL
jgi:hypothetical protein